jgi:hypothetical protein
LRSLHWVKCYQALLLYAFLAGFSNHILPYILASLSEIDLHWGSIHTIRFLHPSHEMDLLRLIERSLNSWVLWCYFLTTILIWPWIGSCFAVILYITTLSSLIHSYCVLLLFTYWSTSSCLLIYIIRCSSCWRRISSIALISIVRTADRLVQTSLIKAIGILTIALTWNHKETKETFSRIRKFNIKSLGFILSNLIKLIIIVIWTSNIILVLLLLVVLLLLLLFHNSTLFSKLILWLLLCLLILSFIFWIRPKFLIPICKSLKLSRIPQLLENRLKPTIELNWDCQV